jgi:Tol biopolymer transport system component
MLSPDGQWFAGLRNQTLWVSKVDGTEARKVPTEIHNPFEYGWFPDGKSVLTGGYADGGKGKRGLFRVDVATGKTETLYTSDQFISNARLSPDGQQIAFGMVGLNVMKAEPNAQPVLLRHGSANPAWSPDGRSIAFIDRPRQAESNRLLVIPAAGGEPKELVGPTPGSLTFPLWSPNGKFIVYSRVADARPDSPPEIWLVSTAGGPPVHLREFDGYLPQTDSCLWSADGKALLFKGRAERPKVSVWSMTNYLPAD